MTAIKNLAKRLFDLQSNAPLVIFRIVFGALMLFSAIRFWSNGWIEQMYLEPDFHFKYWGFSWVEEPSSVLIYGLFIIMLLSALMIMVGLFYRVSASLFFLSFTYIELIDKTYYLNHYYFVSLMALILIFLPAHRRFTLDAAFGLTQKNKQCSKWHVGIIIFQLSVVYIFAGISKINTDWLLEAQPMQNWLHSHHHLPIIGDWLKLVWVAYFMSWAGMLYDISIVFFLSYSKTRIPAYFAVLFFHIFTWLLFPIGVFPWVMIGATLIFFSVGFHEKLLSFFEKESNFQFTMPTQKPKRLIATILSVYVLIQVLLPFRYLLYEGDLFWKEQGYRFSWRVMLIEKAGTAQFYVQDTSTGGKIAVENTDFLTPFQEKMMATQPDMLLQYATYLQEKFQDSILNINNKSYTINNPSVSADIQVTLNGSGTQPFVDNTLNLCSINDNFHERNWIKDYHE